LIQVQSTNEEKARQMQCGVKLSTLSNLLFNDGHIALHCIKVRVIRWMHSVNQCILTYCIL